MKLTENKRAMAEHIAINAMGAMKAECWDEGYDYMIFRTAEKATIAEMMEAILNALQNAGYDVERENNRTVIAKGDSWRNYIAFCMRIDKDNSMKGYNFFDLTIEQVY